MTIEEKYRQLTSLTSYKQEDGKTVITGRHGGTFSPNNPYLIQYQQATKKQDKDYLYEMLTKWEAEWQATQEQRDYESPLAQVQRQKEAGINPDVQGGSSVGTSAGSSAQVDPVNNTVSPYNQTDATSAITGAVSAVGGLLGSVSTLGTSIVGCIDTMKTLPARVKLGEAEAFVADATKDIVVDSARESLKSQQLGNISQTIGNLNSSLDLMSSLSRFITPDMSEEESAIALTTLGIPKEYVPQAQNMVNQWHTNPKYKAEWNNSKVSARKAEVENEVLTREMLKRMTSLTYRVQEIQQISDFHTANLSANLSAILDTEEYAQDLANIEMLSNDYKESTMNLGLLGNSLASQKVQADVESFVAHLGFIRDQINEANEAAAGLLETYNGNIHNMSPEDKALYFTFRRQAQILPTLGTQEFYKARNMAMHTIQQLYLRNTAQTKDGTPYYRFWSGNNATFIKEVTNFDSFLDGTSNENDLVKAIIGAGLSIATTKVPLP